MTALDIITRAASPIHLFCVSEQVSGYILKNLRVELAVSFVGTKHLVREKVSSGLCFFGKGYDIRRRS